MSVSVVVSGQLLISDSVTGTIAMQKQLSNSLLGTTSSIGQSYLVGTAASALPLPISPTPFLYIKNLSTASATVTVSWTSQPNTQTAVCTLEPNEWIMKAGDGFTATAGITALTVSASVVSTPIEFATAG